MIRIDQNNPFTASWNKENARLNPDEGFWNLARKVKNFIFLFPNSIMAACINPRSEFPFHPSSLLTGNYGSFTKEIITSDRIHLTAHVNVVEGATPNTPTVILFNPLGANDSVHHGLKTQLANRRCNVVTFNYRGLGNTSRAEDLIVDGDSVFQFVTQELGTQKNKVHFYGFSLGGALAAQVKALHPESEGKYLGDRPFRSVFSLITENCCIERLGWLVKKITSFVSAIFLAYPIYLLGWEWDGCKALSQLKGDKRIVYHPNDCLVPFEANLAFQCPSDEVICLNRHETGCTTHFAPLDAHSTAEGAPAVAVVADFLSH